MHPMHTKYWPSALADLVVTLPPNSQMYLINNRNSNSSSTPSPSSGSQTLLQNQNLNHLNNSTEVRSSGPCSVTGTNNNNNSNNNTYSNNNNTYSYSNTSIPNSIDSSNTVRSCKSNSSTNSGNKFHMKYEIYTKRAIPRILDRFLGPTLLKDDVAPSTTATSTCSSRSGCGSASTPSSLSAPASASPGLFRPSCSTSAAAAATQASSPSSALHAVLASKQCDPLDLIALVCVLVVFSFQVYTSTSDIIFLILIVLYPSAIDSNLRRPSKYQTLDICRPRFSLSGRTTTS
jgi:hypothetical protein